MPRLFIYLFIYFVYLPVNSLDDREYRPNRELFLCNYHSARKPQEIFNLNHRSMLTISFSMSWWKKKCFMELKNIAFERIKCPYANFIGRNCTCTEMLNFSLGREVGVWECFLLFLVDCLDEINYSNWKFFLRLK